MGLRPTRELSEDGVNFAYPSRHPCSLTYSRILDGDEILVVLNIDIKNKSSDYVMIDRNLSPPKQKMKNLLDEDAQPLVIGEIRRRSFVKVGTSACGIVILKNTVKRLNISLRTLSKWLDASFMILAFNSLN